MSVNYGFSEDIIKQLETRKITLFQSLGLVEVVQNIEQVPSGVAFKERIHNVINKNPRLNCLKLFKDVHCGYYCRLSCDMNINKICTH